MAQWPRTRHLTGPRECTPPHEAGEEADMDAGRCRPKPPFALYAGKATPDDGPGWYQSHCHARARSCVACGSLCTASGRSLTSIPARRSKFARCTAPTPVERTVGLRECTADADRYPRFVSARGGWRESNITRAGGWNRQTPRSHHQDQHGDSQRGLQVTPNSHRPAVGRAQAAEIARPERRALRRRRPSPRSLSQLRDIGRATIAASHCRDGSGRQATGGKLLVL